MDSIGAMCQSKTPASPHPAHSGQGLPYKNDGVLFGNCQKVPECCLMGVAQMDFYPSEVPILKVLSYFFAQYGHFRF